MSDSGATFFSIVYQKKQNEKERWNMIDGSFMTTLPDTWAISKRFIMLPVNNWNDEYERVFLGGMTCDSDDYYNSEQHINAIYLPKFREDRKQYIGYFNTGAYQDTLGRLRWHPALPDPQAQARADRPPAGRHPRRTASSPNNRPRSGCCSCWATCPGGTGEVSGSCRGSVRTEHVHQLAQQLSNSICTPLQLGACTLPPATCSCLLQLTIHAFYIRPSDTS